MAEKAMGTSKTKASTQAKALDLLSEEIRKIEKDIDSDESKLQTAKKDFNEADEKIEGLKDDMASIKKINELQDRKKEWKKHITVFQKKIDENYGRMLLDNQWILMGFEPILEEYNRKLSSILVSKQNVERDFEKKQEEELDKQKTEKAKTELEKIAWKINDVEKMKYMLHTHRCAICGTEATEGSVTYDFIKQRIHDVIELLTPKPTDKKIELKKYFSHENIEDLKKMGEKLIDSENKNHVDIIGIPVSIKAKFDENQKWRDGIAERDELLEKANNKIIRLNANSVSGVNLLEFANDIGTVNQWYSQRESASIERSNLLKRISENKDKLKKKREEQKKLMKASGNDSLYDVFQFFRHLNDAIISAEDTTMKNLLESLTKNANVYLSKLNVDDFTGVIRIYMKNDTLIIDLQDRNGKVITNPNTSLLTTMHISILLSIAELAKENSTTKPEYPLIFDAPTSSFDEGKDKSFYDCINANVEKQCIVVTKSFLYKDKDTGVYEIDYNSLDELKNCKKFRIKKLSDGFDKLDIATIDTQVTEIKED